MGDHIMCTTKIRIWKMKSKHNHYAIEFQRRGGDPFAFGDGYRRCIDFLVLQFPEISERSIEANGTEKQRSMPPPPPAPVDSMIAVKKNWMLSCSLFLTLLACTSSQTCRL